MFFIYKGERERETCIVKCRCTALSNCSLDGLKLLLIYSINSKSSKKLTKSARKPYMSIRRHDLQG
jgi:hypothetical protein